MSDIGREEDKLSNNKSVGKIKETRSELITKNNNLNGYISSKSIDIISAAAIIISEGSEKE